MPSPALPQEVFDQVKLAWLDQDYAWGEKILADARVIYPDHWHLRTCHAAAIAYCSRFHTARAAFDSLLADSPDAKRIHMHGLLGVEWCRIGRYDLALPLLRVATAAENPPAPVFEALGTALERLNSPEEALAALDEGLRRHPGHPGILLALARAQRRLKRVELSASTARLVIDSRIASPEAKAAASIELGHALDAMGRFGEAFAAFQSAKRVRQPLLTHFLSQWEQRRNLIETMPLPSRDDFIRWRVDRSADEPVRFAVLVGCPRSGTTLLERVLDSHPELIAAPESAVFDSVWRSHLRSMGGANSQLDAINRLAQGDVASMRSDYQIQMEDALEQAIGERVILDKNPSLLARVPAIMKVFPEAHVLMAERDPRAIAWSCFIQHLPENAESAAFNALESTAAHVAVHLQFWQRLRERLPEGSWHETRYERVVGQFNQEVRRTLEFLGLPWTSQIEAYHENPALVRSPSYADASKPVYQHALEKWRNYEPFFGDAFKVLEKPARDMGYPI